MDVAGTAQGKIDEAHADRGIGEAVDDDEAAECLAFMEGRERHGLIKIKIANADFIQGERFGRRMFQRVHIDLELG